MQISNWIMLPWFQSCTKKKEKPLEEAITPIITVVFQPLAAKQSRCRSLLQICLCLRLVISNIKTHLWADALDKFTILSATGQQITEGLTLPLSLSCTQRVSFSPHQFRCHWSRCGAAICVPQPLSHYFYHSLHPLPLKTFVVKQLGREHQRRHWWFDRFFHLAEDCSVTDIWHRPLRCWGKSTHLLSSFRTEARAYEVIPLHIYVSNILMRAPANTFTDWQVDMQTHTLATNSIPTTFWAMLLS